MTSHRSTLQRSGRGIRRFFWVNCKRGEGTSVAIDARLIGRCGVPKLGARPEKPPICRLDAIFGTSHAEDAWVQFEAGSPPGTSE